MGRPKLGISDLTDSNVDLFMYLMKGIGSAYEKFDVWTGP